jgi:hypothetical protein
MDPEDLPDKWRQDAHRLERTDGIGEAMAGAMKDCAQELEEALEG